MGKSTIQQGKLAAVECSPNGCCYDDENRCVHCREHIADPHEPTCVHAAEPVDECDARPAEEVAVFEVHVEVRAVDGDAAAREVLATLARHGFDLHRGVAGVWRKREHGPSEFVGVARLVDAGEVAERA